MRARILPIFLTFFVMGVADAMGPLSNAVKSQFQLSNVVAKLLPFAVFIAFAAFSVPGGVLAARIGKKRVLLAGLALNTAAVLIPSAFEPGYPLLLACIFLLGAGTTLLQVAGNPIARDVSAEGKYARNLTFAQFVKGVGSFASTSLVALAAGLPLLGVLGWRSAFPIFAALMALAFLAVALLKVEEAKAEVPPSVASSLGLLKVPTFALAVLGIFLYVGAEVCMASFLEPHLTALGLAAERANLLGPTLFFIGITAGRLLGSGVLGFLGAGTFFRLSAALGGLGIVGVMAGGPTMAVAGVVACGLGFANIWPLLFALTVEREPGRSSELSGLMCMAISGGALLPLLMGKVADAVPLAVAFSVPLAAFVYLVVLSLRPSRRPAEA